MWCPLCAGEYREGFTVCSDSQVALVTHPPGEPSADASTADESFALLWAGTDSRVRAEICEALDQQKISARTLGREDHLFSPTMRPEFEVYVPARLLSAARGALHQANPTDDDSERLSDSQQLLDSGILEIPAEDQLRNSPDDDDARGDIQNLDPRDATVEIWSGQDADMAAMITSSLGENRIPCRPDTETSDPDIAGPNSQSDEIGATRLFVFPEDEKRAKEIIREIVDATPPE
jgi:hypothetical protein